MKKLLIVALSLCLSILSVGQSTNVGSAAPGPDIQVEITPFIGYQMGASTNYYSGRVRYRDGESYQLAMNFDIVDAAEIELSYNYSESTIELENYYGGYPTFGEKVDSRYHFYQIGVLKGYRVGAIKPYGLFSIGAAHMTFPNPDQIENGYSTSDVWRFAFTAGLGAKVFLTDRIGIRAQFKLNAPISGVGFGVSCGGGGCGSGVSTTSFFVQGEIQGGIVIALKPADSYSSQPSSAPANSSASLWY